MDLIPKIIQMRLIPIRFFKNKPPWPFSPAAMLLVLAGLIPPEEVPDLRVTLER